MLAERDVDRDNPARQWYRSAGLRIVSAFPLDDLAPTEEPGVADLSIEEGLPGKIDQIVKDSIHVGIVGETDAPWLEVRSTNDSFIARWPGQLDVVVPNDGRRLIVLQRGEVHDSLARLLLCHGVSFALPAHGREALHASAVEIDGKAVVIAGGSGRGKSTMATALCLAGGRLLSDDMTCIRVEDGVAMVDPTSTRTWLASELADTLTGEGSGTMMQRTHKLSIGGGVLNLATRPVPLGAIFLLGYRANAEFSEPLDPRAAMKETLGALFNFTVRTQARMTTQFDIVTNLIDRVPVRTLRWNPSPAASKDVAEEMIALAGRGRQPRLAAVPNAPVAAPASAKPAANGSDERLLRTSEVAAILRSSDRTIRAWADAGKLQYIKTLGGRRLFPESNVMAVLHEMRAAYPDGAN